MVSPVLTRSVHRARRCRFISSMLRNGRFQTSRIERSAECMSDQIQVLSGGVSMLAIAALCIAGQLRLGAGAGAGLSRVRCQSSAGVWL